MKKIYGELLGEMDEEELRISEELKDLWDFIDDRWGVLDYADACASSDPLHFV